MFRFETPQLLYGLLVLLPLFIAVVAAIKSKSRKISKLGDATLIKALIPDYSTGKHYTKALLLISCTALLIVCLANPQLGTTVKKAERKGIDVMIALDISNSMNCEDIQPSRLMRSKQAIIRLLDKLENDRIGLVVFAGDAFLQLPLTSDYGAARLFISNISTDDISAQGTSIGKAIRLCMDNFEQNSKEKQNVQNTHSEAIIIISDGEDHDEDASEAAQDAAKAGIMVNTIGMGLPQGAPIPIHSNGQIVDYKKDRDGNVIITQLNEAMLNQIALTGKGYYVGANNTSAGIETMFDKLNKLDKVLLEQRSISDYESKYQYPLLLALILLILDIFIFEKRHKVFNRQNIFGRKTKPFTRTLLLVCSFLLCGTISSHAQMIPLTHQGNKQYERKNYVQSEEYYRKALSQDSLAFRTLYNLGNAEYRQKKYEHAAQQYTKALQNPTASPLDRSKASHNLGNSYLQMQDYNKAIDAYKQALRYNSTDQDTKYNLAYAQKMLIQQQNQQNKTGDKNKKDDKSQKDQQNQNKQNQDQNKKDKQDQDKQQQQKDPGSEQSDQAAKQKKMKQNDAERMLQALENQEKNTLDKIKNENFKVT